MELSDIPPLLDQAQGVFNQVDQTFRQLQTVHQTLLSLRDSFIEQNLPSSYGTDLQQAGALLDDMISSAPFDGEQHDVTLRSLQQAASELQVAANDPAAPGVLTLVLEKRDFARTLRESIHVMNQEMREHDGLESQIDFQPNGDDAAFMTTHRLVHDKLQLLTSNYMLTLDKAIRAIDGIRLDIEIISDPRVLVQGWGDQFPVALLPVRVETRFMTIKHVRNNKQFVTAAEAFRTDEDVSLTVALNQADALSPVMSMPVAGTLQPAPVSIMIPDKHELWIRIYPDDIAVHTHEEQLVQHEIDAALVYWEEVWRAGNVVDDELGAWRVLVAAYGPQRAAWIARETTPTNPGSKPASPVPRPTPLAVMPALPALTTKSSSWTEQPRTYVMPDRFVVRAYNSVSGNTYREVVGSAVPSPLPIGPDPANSYTSYLNQSGTGINMPPELRWLTDFEEAEAVGMAIRIPLIGNEPSVGFERLLVLGLKTSLSPSDSQAALERLMDNHHFKTGLALVPQGTPTNNTEDAKSGFSIYEPGNEGSFGVERQGPLFTPTATHYLKADGQRLAEALGISYSILQHVPHADTFDVKESIAMNRALWSATLGYYMTNLLTPAVLSSTVANTRDFFTNYVHGRGLVPAFRVGNQPYGVLPATVYSRFKHVDPFTFEGKMFTKILKPLNTYWEQQFVPQVKHVQGAATDPTGLVVDILGLHPASLQFHQRITSGPYLLSNLISFASAAGLGSAGLPIFNWALINNIISLYNTGIGFNLQSIPRILTMTFMTQHRLLNGPVIDTLGLSEIRTVENVKNGNANYIQWLLQSSLQQVRTEDFTNIGAPAGQAPPQALLYLLLRHAWFLEYLEASLCLLKNTGTISADAGQHYELINVALAQAEPEITQEHRDILFGVVRGEAVYEQGVLIDDVMRNLETNQDYLESGLTPEQYELHLWDQAAPQIEQAAQERFGPRLDSFRVEQGLWDYLTQPFEAVSGALTMEDHITNILLSGSPCVYQLQEVSDALNLLKTLPTARLERLLAEHLDTCAYRLDSWMGAMVSKRLNELRAANPNGIYLGAYSILEKVKPGPVPGIRVVNVDTDVARVTWQDTVAMLGARKELARTTPGNMPVDPAGSYLVSIASQYQPASFIYVGDDPTTHLVEDRQTGRIYAPPIVDAEGFILAPSMSHAVTAAILRAGYVAHRTTTSGPDALAVNMTSARVRKAMFFMEGIRNGQTLGALLGYQFERGLHEHFPQPASPPYSLDKYIFEIRAKYPLVAGGVVSTPTGSSHADAQTSHVTDGLKLIEAYRKPSPPWTTGVFTTTPTTQEMNAIVQEIEAIIDAMDAVGDLMIAEAVFQVTKGNHERAGAVLKALGYGSKIPEPEIVNTPRQGNVIVNRCAVQLQPATATAGAWTGSSSRALTEPNLNSWLAAQLPLPSDILINTTYTNLSNVVSSTNVSIDDLGLQPLDFVMLFTNPGSDQQADGSELSNRVRYYVQQNLAQRDDLPVNIDYRSRAMMNSAQRTIFEMMPVMTGLVRVIGNSRMMDPADFLMGGDAGTIPSNPPMGTGWDSSNLVTRLGQAISAINSPTTGLIDVLNNCYNAPFNATNITNIRNALILAARYGIDNVIPDTAVTVSQEAYDALLIKAAAAKKELQKRMDALVVLHPSPAPPTDRYNDAVAMTEGKEKVTELAEVAKIVYGRAFKVFADFTLYNSTEVQNSLNYPTLLNEAGSYGVEEWMQGVCRVRPRVGDYYKQMLLSESVANPAFYTQRVVQIPVIDMATNTDRWVGMKLPAGYEVPGEVVSLVIESDLATPLVPTCGMVIDEWNEKIPVDKVTTGIAMHYDQPNNEAPQAVLLATTPEIKGYWVWDDLMDTLNETALMAAKRAVEPDMIQQSDLSQVLPALVTPMTGGTDTSPSLDLGRNCIVAPPGFNNPIDFTAFIANPLNSNDLTINNGN